MALVHLPHFMTVLAKLLRRLWVLPSYLDNLTQEYLNPGFLERMSHREDRISFLSFIILRGKTKTILNLLFLRGRYL